MAHFNVHRDPGVSFGHYRVLPYTPGGFVVVDERRPPGKQCLYKTRSLDDASDYAASRFETEKA